MKLLNLIIFASLSYIVSNSAQDNKKINYEAETIEWQKSQNEKFKDTEKSPLTEKGLEKFDHLEFFDYNSKYVIKAKLTYTPFSSPFKMKTTTDRLPEYKKFAIASFELDGVKCELSLYQNTELITKKGYENYLFIPYNDLTNGSGSYGGGRYIDVEKSGSDDIIINFNKSYNPYCAYNPKYSCPIPPRENTLNVKIKAGVLSYKKGH